MSSQVFFHHLRDLIARDELDTALAQLRELLTHSPLLDEAIHQAGRYENIRTQIRLGVVSHEDANLTRNQISIALLELIGEVEQYAGQVKEPNAGHSDGVTLSHPVAKALQAELAQAISVFHSKNVVQGSSIQAGGGVHIGDKHEHKHFAESKTPRLLTTPPFNSEIFLGRKNDLTAIEDDYKQNNRLLILVNGEGGIGKTTLASKYWYAHEARYKHLAWLYADAGIGAALISLKEKLGVAFTQEDSFETQLQRMAETLSNLESPCLIVFDNANNETDLKQHYSLLHRLPNCHILLTSRVRKLADMKIHKVEPLKPEEAVDLFKHHYPELEEAELPLLHDVLNAIAYNTLVTEVLAKNLSALNRFARRYSLAELLQDLQKKGLLALKNKTVQVVHGSGTLREATPADIIGAMYDLAQLDEQERRLLSNLSALPAENIPFPLLSALLGADEDSLESPLGSLETKGWIEYRKSDNSFKISPVIQEVYKSKNAERLLEDCRTLIKVLLTGLNSDNRHTNNYQAASVFARLAAAVVQALPLPDLDLVVLCQNIGNYHKDTGNLNGMMQYYKRMLNIQTALFESDPDNADFKNGLAISYEKLGLTHRALGNLTQALTFFEKYNDLEKELHEAYPLNVKYKEGLGWSNQFLGHTNSALGNLDDALAHYSEMSKIFEELHEAYPLNVDFKNGLAISYEKFGETHTALGNLTQALTFFEKYNDLEKELHEAYPLNVDFKNILAISYGNLGSTHTALGNLTQALTFFEKCIELSEELHEAYPLKVDFKYGLAISYSKLGETHTALGNLTQALTFFEERSRLGKELHEAYPLNVDFKNGLATSYLLLGQFYKNHLEDEDKARQFIQKGHDLYVELLRDFPNYQSFKQNYEWAKEHLSIDG